MRIFVTGATGLLGINLVNELLERGHSVTALVRNPQKAERVLPVSAHLQTITGDIENAEPWIARLQNHDGLIHAAAYFREYFGRGDHAPKLNALNVEIPVRLAKAASEYGVSKTVIISSSGVNAPRPDGSPCVETDIPGGKVMDNLYFQSKVQMEKALQQTAPTLSNSLVVIRPGWMFGPNDYAPTSAGQLVLDLLRTGRLQMVGGTPTHVADARDVARAIAVAVETVSGYEVFNVAGNPLTAVQALRMVAKEAGRGTVQEVPFPLAMLLSGVLEPISKFQNKPNPIPRVGLITLHNGVAVSSEKAIQQLGATFRPFPETARDTVAFMRQVFLQPSSGQGQPSPSTA